MSYSTIRSPRLRLEPLNADYHEHIEGLHAISSEPRCYEWSTASSTGPMKETKALVVEWARRGYKDWAIMLLSDEKSSTDVDADTVAEQKQKPKMIGIIGMHKQQTNPAALAYKLNATYWRNGYMSEALKLFINIFWILEEYSHLPQLIAGVDPENIASRRVLEKAGFHKGKLLREEYERFIHKGQNRKKSDIQLMCLDRPQVVST